LARLFDTASKFALFLVSGLKDAPKSIFIILSYIVSNLARFLRHSVECRRPDIMSRMKLCWEAAWERWCRYIRVRRQFITYADGGNWKGPSADWEYTVV